MTTAAFTEAEKAQAIECLSDWFRLDTWTVREGLLLLVGIDPLRSGDLNFIPEGVTTGPNPAWARITKKPGVLVGEDNVPRPDGLIMEPMAMYRLWELMRFWRATPGHSDDWDSRAEPSYFVSWAQSKDFAPFWASWLELPASTSVEDGGEALVKRKWDRDTAAAAREYAHSLWLQGYSDYMKQTETHYGVSRTWLRKKWDEFEIKRPGQSETT